VPDKRKLAHFLDDLLFLVLGAPTLQNTLLDLAAHVGLQLLHELLLFVFLEQVGVEIHLEALN
jgi:hypothetical protein